MVYQLSAGSLTAVADEMGGELISLKNAEGKEYLWQGNPEIWSGRNPNLFPIVGGLMDGTIRFNNVPYQMNRHGFARNSRFTLVESGVDYVVFELLDSEDTLHRFPFHFSLRIKHQLTEHGFSTTFHITNPGDITLPFCIGGHTAFRCPDAFETYRLVFECTEHTSAMIPSSLGYLNPKRTAPHLSGSNEIRLTHDLFDRVDTLIFRHLQSTTVSLLDQDGHGVRMDFSQFPLIAFWSPPGKNAPFICLEPWHGCAAMEDESGEFTDKPYCINLLPKQSTSLTYSVTLV